MRGLTVLVIVLSGLGCSSGTTGTDGGTDAANDVAATPVNGCSTYTDDTATAATITGPSTATPAQYTPNCVHIKVGQTVTWNADFTDHPLIASSGMGTTPNPIPATAAGTTVTVTFSAAGTFAYNCNFHPSVMLGAVEVTP
jgi:plastocyanin